MVLEQDAHKTKKESRQRTYILHENWLKMDYRPNDKMQNHKTPRR